MGLEKVTFNPSTSVLYQPDKSKQMVELAIENPTDKPVTFKMKSTRPGLYKMRPVYGLAVPGDKAIVRLIFKGLKPGQAPPAKDRFTVIYTHAPTSSVNVQKMWTKHKYHQKLVDNELKKHKISVLYKGVNDNVPSDAFQDQEVEEEKKKVTIRKGVSGLEEEERRGIEAAAMAAAAAAAAAAQGEKKPVLLMFRESKPVLSDSVSEEEEEKDEEGDEDKEEEGSRDVVPAGDPTKTAPLAANVQKSKPSVVPSKAGAVSVKKSDTKQAASKKPSTTK